MLGADMLGSNLGSVEVRGEVPDADMVGSNLGSDEVREEVLGVDIQGSNLGMLVDADILGSNLSSDEERVVVLGVDILGSNLGGEFNGAVAFNMGGSSETVHISETKHNTVLLCKVKM